MYNSNKNKYLVYIMADTKIKFKTAISNAYKHLKKTEIKFNDAPNKILKESDIIKQLIDKLNEITSAADAPGDADAGEAGTNNKIAISITKYNYGYYLNTIEDKEYALFLKIYIYLLSYSDINSTIKYFINNFKKIYKIYKKNIIHYKKNNILYYLFYFIHDKINNNYNYNYNFTDAKNYILQQLISENNLDEECYNLSCKILITFLEFINIDNINNDFIISYKTTEDKNILYILSFIFGYKLKINSDKIFTILNTINDDNPLFNKAKNFLTSIKDIPDKENKIIEKIEIDKIIESLYEPYKNTNYLIINKDKNIIDIFKENPEIEDNYNIDNNSLELVEISKDKINFNNNTYKLIGYIDENDKYTDIGDGGAAGDGGKDDEGGGDGGGDGGKGGEDKKQNINYKLFIYEKNKDKEEEEKDKEEKENIIDNLKALYKNSNCDDIKLMWDNNSCYMDSLFVALFNTKHKFMDDLLFNLEISKDIIINNKDNYKDIYYHVNIIKLNLIHLYNKISNKKIKEKEKEQCTNEFRKSLEYCFTNIKVKIETTGSTETTGPTETINNIIKDKDKDKDKTKYDFTTKSNSPVILFRLLTYIFNIDAKFYNIQPMNSELIKGMDNIDNNQKNKLFLYDSIETYKNNNLNSIILYRPEHYICLFKCNNDEWYEYDDHKNTSDSKSEVSITKIKYNDYKEHIKNGIEIEGTIKKYIVVGLYYI